MQRLRVVSILMLSLMISFVANAQQEPKVRNSSIYESEVDKNLTIKKIAILPVSDNVDGIYARPAEEQLKDLLNKDARFQTVDSQYAGAMVSIDDLESNPQQIKDITQNINAEAVIACRITKGPDGVSTHMSLFLKSDGMLVSREIFKGKATSDIKNIRSVVSDLFSKVMKQIPYDGLVLSRNNSLVTLNIGKKYGLVAGQTVTAVLVIKATRHPKFHFIISSDKEVLGKIKLQKVDEAISFGQIIVEKDPGAIQKDTKISGVDFVQYTDQPLGDAFQKSNTNPQENKITFGENPKEWKPSNPPSFGKVGAQLSLGQMKYNTHLNSAGSQDGNDSLYPAVKIYTELWFTQELIFDFELQQGVISISNPLSGSSPGKLSANQSAYLLSFGYNFMIQDDFFGPSILVSLGFANYQLDVDSSTPLSFTSTRYKGIFLGLRGTMPVTEDKKWNLGASLKYFLTADLSESPQDSGGSDNTITQFSFIGYYQVNTKLRYTGSIDFSLFSSQFSGSNGSRTDKATDASQKYTTLSGGLEYLF